MKLPVRWRSRIGLRGATALSWQRAVPILTRLRVASILLGCALLFWQYDGAPSDWLFGIAILATLVLWWRRQPALDLAWPQILVLGFAGATGLATIAAGGSLPAFLITAYLVILSLTIASVLREDRRLLRIVETGLILSGCVAALLICVGYASRQLGWQALEVLSYDALRGQGLFKDPNAAGAFVACTYPFAAARVGRGARRPEVFVLLATAVFGAGVIFSFSREALLLFVLGFVAATVGFGLLRQRRPFVTLVAFSAAAVIAFGALDRLPAYRGYQFLAAYDQNGRFVVWRFAIDMLRQAPLGTGAGSFERRSQAFFDTALGRNTAPARIDVNGAAGPPVDQAAGFHSSVVSQPAVLLLPPGTLSDPVSFVFRNTGTRAWSRGVTGQEAQLGIGEAGLQLEALTGPPIAQLSHFDDLSDDSIDAAWPAAQRLAVQTEQVVGPGAEASFTFQIRAPHQAGTYRLHVRPVVDGATWLEDDGLALEITVAATAASSSANPSLPSGTAPAGSEIMAPAAPSPYALPTDAVRVSTSAQLVTALAGPTRDIILASGAYDNPEPFYDPSGHRLYAATLGGAVLRAGISLGANDGPGGGLIQGVAFDVNDPAKTLVNSVVHIWGPGGVGAQVLDVTINGRKLIGAGISALPLEGIVVERVIVRDVTDHGVIVLPGGDRLASPIDLEDLDIRGVASAVPGSSSGTREACISLANTTTVRRALVGSCGVYGVWVGAGNAGSMLEHLDIDGAGVGVYLDETVSGLRVSYAHTGTFVGTGVLAANLASRQPTPLSQSSNLVVVPSAHNTYFRVAAESGALGFIAFGAYLILMLWSLWSGSWRESWAICVGMGLVLFAGFGIDTLHWRLLWIYLGIAAAVGPRSPAPVAPPAYAVALLTTGTLGVAALGMAVRADRALRAYTGRMASAIQIVWAPSLAAADGAAQSMRRLLPVARGTWRTVSTPTTRVVRAVFSGMLPRLRLGLRRFWLTWRAVLSSTRQMATERSHVDAAVAALEPVVVGLEGDAIPNEEDPSRAASDLASEDLRRAEIRLAAKQYTLGFDHLDVADELHLIGSIHHDAGRYNEALAFYSTALAIRARIVGETHPVVAPTLDDLAAVRRDDGDDAEAERLIAQANSIREAWRGTLFLTAQAAALERDKAADPLIPDAATPDRVTGPRPHGPSTRPAHRSRARGAK